MALAISHIKIIRQRLDLEEDDDSEDDRINAMTPREKLCHLVAWELGYPGWADWLFFGTTHECRYDRDGFINIGVSGGRMGLRPSEFQVLRWGINHLLDGGELTEAINFAKLMIMTGEERKLRTDIPTTFPPDFPLSMYIEMRRIDQQNMRKSHLMEAAAAMCDTCKSGDAPLLFESVAPPDVHAVGPLYVHVDGDRFHFCLASPIHILIDQDNHE